MKRILILNGNDLNATATTDNNITSVDDMSTLGNGNLGIFTSKGRIIAGAGTEVIEKDAKLIFAQGRTSAQPLLSEYVTANAFKAYRVAGNAGANRVVTFTIPTITTAMVGYYVECRIINSLANLDKTNRYKSFDYLVAASGTQNTIATVITALINTFYGSKLVATVSGAVITLTGSDIIPLFKVISGADIACTIAQTTAYKKAVNTGAELIEYEKWCSARNGGNQSLEAADLWGEPTYAVAGTTYTTFTLLHREGREESFDRPAHFMQELVLAIPSANTALIALVQEILADLMGVANLTNTSGGTSQIIIECPAPIINTGE